MAEGTSKRVSEDKWKLFRSTRVAENHKINLLDDLCHLAFDDQLIGKCVLWSFDVTQKTAIISNYSIEGDRYNEHRKSTYQLPSGHVVPPKAIRENVDGEMRVKDTVYYLATEDMLEGSSASVFLLTSEQVSKGIAELNLDPVTES